MLARPGWMCVSLEYLEGILYLDLSVTILGSEVSWYSLGGHLYTPSYVQKTLVK